MAEGFLKSFDDNLQIFSAGTNPSKNVHPKAIAVMKEIGIDLSENKPKNVSQFLNSAFNFVITVCGGAKESCPAFTGNVKNRLHISFEDPADAIGTEEEISVTFRIIRDQIKQEFKTFYENQINKNLIKKLDSTKK